MTRVLQLSDTHLMAAGALHNGLVDTTAALVHALEALRDVGPLDAVVVSGDVSDDGTVASYEAARDLVGGFAAERGAVAVFAMGNHDVAGPFEQVLGPTRSVHDVAGVRIVVLDSSVPGRGYGELPAEQLSWAREVLADPAPRGSVVVVHHSPLPAPTVLHEGLRLQRPAELLDALAGTDVRAVLSGHYHHPFAATLPSGLAAFVAPAVANRCDVLVAPGRERILRGSGALLVDLDERGVRATVLTVPVPGDGEELFVLDEETVTRILAQAGVPG
ncbi:metallophosphoesterase family protein [Kineococcus radiotolerans]|uniref:Metallophosphoesterase n=1 Tax=Kineococcus radiotolerans (strain ATCC BAA-149 / DSM 14245 / SRS30216) TaxID=266940 RepID=A6W423_KINRD|nr:metallophosphoesterase [Kineococcus radiotolerans]ABS01562.1 metallophosphoesterase [Kineococcus radiotolerans SRS30216 = ATCC BAA-149]